MTDIQFDGVSLGEVQDLRESVQCGLVATPIPGEPNAQIYDIGGISKSISITTKYRSTTAGITSFLSQLDNWSNGKQTGRTLSLPFGRSKTNMCCILNWDYNIDSSVGGQTDAGSNIVITATINVGVGSPVVNIWGV